MSQNEEPGLFALLSSFFGSEEFVCTRCKNGKATVVFSCPCGEKITLCAPCMCTEHEWNTLVNLFEEHREKCEDLQCLVRASRVANIRDVP